MLNPLSFYRSSPRRISKAHLLQRRHGISAALEFGQHMILVWIAEKKARRIQQSMVSCVSEPSGFCTWRRRRYLSWPVVPLASTPLSESSSNLTRSVISNICSFDIDLPIDCDDARWYNDNPAHAFHQPHGTPSKIAFFNAYLNLSHILANAFRFLVSAFPMIEHSFVYVFSIVLCEETRASSGCHGGRMGKVNNDQYWGGPERMGRYNSRSLWVISCSAMRIERSDGLFKVRWDEDMTDPIFFNQSVLLHVMFYNIQILVHRPLMIDPTDPKAMTTSLAICLNAAQGCIRVMDTHRLRGTGFIPQIQVRLVHLELQ